MLHMQMSTCEHKHGHKFVGLGKWNDANYKQNGQANSKVRINKQQIAIPALTQSMGECEL